MTQKAVLSGVYIESNGGPGTIRTPDPQIRSLVLYPAELRVRRRRRVYRRRARDARGTKWKCRVLPQAAPTAIWRGQVGDLNRKSGLGFLKRQVFFLTQVGNSSLTRR